MRTSESIRIAAALAVSLGSALEVQVRTLTVSGTPQCATCSIELTKVATVGSPTDPVLFVNYSQVYRGPRNTILVSNTLYATPPTLLLHDSTGKFLREIGRSGQGPGEFPSFVSFIGLGPGDSLYLRERLGRVQVFSSTFEFGRAIPAFGIQSSVNMVLPNGNFLGFLTPSRGEVFTAPIRLVSPDGRDIRKFGVITPDENEANYFFSTRYASLNRERTHIWVARRNQYDIQRFSIDGERDLALTVEGSNWMKNWLEVPTAPFSSLIDVEDAGNNRIWVAGQAPSPGATSFLRPNTGAWPMRLEQNLSTAIDIIDTQRGTLLASRRFENEIYLFIDPDHVVRQRADANGVVSFDVYRISLRQR